MGFTRTGEDGGDALDELFELLPAGMALIGYAAEGNTGGVG